MNDEAQIFALNAHRSTNHYYDTYLPYEFHLRMVVKVADDFKHLIHKDWHDIVISACWLHDTIEDCRVNYNDINKATRYEVAEIVRACTNYTRGRNRAERMPKENYADLRTIPNALFVKLCDRIANVQYSKMTGSSMFEMYKKEHEHFVIELRYDGLNPELQPMWSYLDELLGME